MISPVEVCWASKLQYGIFAQPSHVLIVIVLSGFRALKLHCLQLYAFHNHSRFARSKLKGGNDFEEKRWERKRSKNIWYSRGQEHGRTGGRV